MTIHSLSSSQPLRDYWRPLPLFLGYEISSQKEVRHTGSGRVLTPTPHRNQVRVSIWDRVSCKHRVMALEYLWEMANADANQLARMEMKIRPETVIQNLLTDIFSIYCRPGELEKLEPRDRLALAKFLYSLQTDINKKKPTKSGPSIDEMRRYALRLQRAQEPPGYEGYSDGELEE